MGFEDTAELLQDLYAAAVTANVYDPTAKTFATDTISGDISAATLVTTGNVDVGGTFGVDGAATFDAAVSAGSLSVAGTTIAASTGNTDVNGTLGVDGAAVFDSSITADSLSVAGTTIATATGNTDVNGTLGVDGVATFDTDVTVGGNATVTGHFGCNGVVAQAKSSPYTLTYSTQARTVPAATAAGVATTASTQTTPWGFASQAQADAVPVAINALEADVIALKKVIVSLVADLQANGIAG